MRAMTIHDSRLLQAAQWIVAADSLIITAGAGMGVDSGLPDFRGREGFWRAYPPLAEARIQFEQIACPSTFYETPERAWGLYGHRLGLYRCTVPHQGFDILRSIVDRLALGAFVFTSNVDGQFQKAGFDEDRIIECHGSIHRLQCLYECECRTWSAGGFAPKLDEAACRLVSRLPECPLCRSLARPNILMFGDWNWVATPMHEQRSRFRRWRQQVERPVVIELGAGTAIPSARLFGEEQNCPLIRINPTEWHVGKPDDAGLPLGALAGLRAIAHEP